MPSEKFMRHHYGASGYSKPEDNLGATTDEVSDSLRDDVKLAFKTCNQQRVRILELEAKLAALQWRRITEQDLPQLGDEIGQWVKQRNGPTYFEVASSVNHQDAQSLFALGWTYFRAINAPPADKAGA